MSILGVTFRATLPYLFVCISTHNCSALMANIASNHNLVETAKSHYTTQQQEEAFKLFLQALAGTSVQNDSIFSDSEQALYEQAFQIYSSKGWQHCYETDEHLIQDFEPLIKEHPDYYRLGYIVAAAYANQGHFNKFFDLFFICYQNCPNHYLAHKSKAILYLKLFQRALPGPEKEIYRASLQEQLRQAAARYPADTSLYKLQIGYAPEGLKAKIIAECVQAIIAHNAIIPRCDLSFFLDEVLHLEDVQLTQAFLFKAKEWYQFSRIINEAYQKAKQ